MKSILKKLSLAFYYILGNKISDKIYGNEIRRILLGRILKETGKNVKVFSNVYIGNGEKLSIGNNTLIGADSRLVLSGEIIIGNDVQIGPKIMILTGNHNFKDFNVPFSQQGSTSKPVIIENDVWIGANVTILPGVKISKGSVVGAGAVVTKNTEPYTIVAGNPAKKIGSRI